MLAAVLAVVRWPLLVPAQRAMRLGVAAWLLAAWFELALAQRYSSHYFSILALPTWLAAATAVADLGALAPPRRIPAALRAALPALVALAVMFTSTEGEYRAGIAAAADFTGVHDLALARRQAEGGTVRTVRGTIDLVSRPGDALLAWTERPWTYLQWDRIAATRYVWGSFLLGRIYLGGAGPQFVPPHTAEWFADDLARSDPQVFVEEVENPVPPDSLVGEVVAADFVPVYEGPSERVYVRREAAADAARAGHGQRAVDARRQRPRRVGGSGRHGLGDSGRRGPPAGRRLVHAARRPARRDARGGDAVRRRRREPPRRRAASASTCRPPAARRGRRPPRPSSSGRRGPPRAPRRCRSRWSSAPTRSP